MPLLSSPNGMCEQAPKISGLVPSDLAIACSTVVRGDVYSGLSNPDRQFTIPLCVSAAPGYWKPEYRFTYCLYCSSGPRMLTLV
jgi:hypothetical protein